MSAPTVTRTAARRRLTALEAAAREIRAAYGDEEEAIVGMLRSGPTVRLGDMLRVPDNIADMKFSLWEVVWMLDAMAKVLRADLQRAEGES